MIKKAKRKDQILSIIRENPGAKVAEIAQVMNTKPNNVQAHLVRFKKENLIQNSDYGRYVLTDLGLKELEKKPLRKPVNLEKTENPIKLTNSTSKITIEAGDLFYQKEINLQEALEIIKAIENIKKK